MSGIYRAVSTKFVAINDDKRSWFFERLSDSHIYTSYKPNQSDWNSVGWAEGKYKELLVPMSLWRW